MIRLRRACAVLRDRLTPPDLRSELLASAEQRLKDNERMLASLRASLDDATRTIARLSGEKAWLERVLRTILEQADHGLANPTENHR